jgi:group I intron endonuclease
MPYVYIIKNKINNLVYVGVTKVNINARFHQHTKPSTLIKRNYKLQKAIKELGVENFYCELLEEIDEKEMFDKEVYYIKKYDSFHNGYNSTPGGKGGKIIVDEKDVKNVVNSYLNNFNIKELALKYNVCEETIKRLLSAHNIEIKKKLKTKSGYIYNDSVRTFDSKEEKENLISDYDSGMTYKELALKYNVDERTIGRKLKSFKIVRRGKGNARKKIKV